MAKDEGATPTPEVALSSEQTDDGREYEYKIKVNSQNGAALDVYPFGPVEHGKSIKVKMTAARAERYKASPLLEVTRA